MYDRNSVSLQIFIGGKIMYALATQSAGGSWALLIVVYAVIFGGFYFVFLRPQKKEQKRP